MNKLSNERKKQILSMLVEGMSIRSIERITETHRDTIMRLAVRIGKGCEKLLKDNMKGFHSKYLQADEIWTFVGKKERKLNKKEQKNPELGDQYIYVALDADTKLIPVYTVGKRTAETTIEFISELKNKLNGNGRVQITTDGFPQYKDAIEEKFGMDIDFAMQIKNFASINPGPGRYSPHGSTGWYPRLCKVILMKSIFLHH